MFFKKKEKDNLIPAKKQGCLKNLIIGIIILVILGVAGVFAVRNALGMYGVSFTRLKDYAEWLSEPVVEADLTNNAIRDSDAVSLKNKAIQAGFAIYNAEGNVNLNLTSYSLNDTLVLQDYELGALINESAKGEDNPVYKLLELSIVENTDGRFTITTVVKFNLSGVKGQLDKFADKIPDSIYITSIGQLSKVGSRFQTSDNEIFINKLSNDKNKELVDLITKIQDDGDDDIKSVKDINNYMVAEILTKINQKTEGANATLGNHTFSLIKG